MPVPNDDPKAILFAWAPLVTLRLNTESPNSPATKTVTCFNNKLLADWSGTNADYLTSDRAQRIFYNNWHDFDPTGYMDSLRGDLLFATRWSARPDAFGTDA